VENRRRPAPGFNIRFILTISVEKPKPARERSPGCRALGVDLEGWSPGGMAFKRRAAGARPRPAGFPPPPRW